MTQQTQIAQKEKKPTATQMLASRLNVSRDALIDTLKKTAFKECRNDAEFMAAVVVAQTYNLNPLVGEVYVFPSKKGGVTPIVPIDGWISLVNRQPNNDGVELIENRGGEGKVESVTAKFFMKDKSHPVVVTEYMDECFQAGKTPWEKWPIRMLRHKAYIQGARVAYGFSGIYDPDEADRIDLGLAGEEKIEPPKALEKPKEDTVIDVGEEEPVCEEKHYKNMKDLAAQVDIKTDEAMLDFLVGEVGVQNPDKVTLSEYAKACELILARMGDKKKDV